LCRQLRASPVKHRLYYNPRALAHPLRPDMMMTPMTRPLKAGLMVPINNTTFEHEILGWLPSGSTCTTLRIPRGKGLLTTETLPAYKAQALALAAEFKTSGVDVVAYGCTAAGFISGPKGDAELARELETITGKPVVTVARSMVIALQEVGARSIALVTPYMDIVNDQLKAFLADGGIGVRRFASFYAPDVDALGRITATQVAELARKTMDCDCDALFIACAQLPTLPILDELQREFGRPALSSIKVTTEHAIRACA
jgi:maleate cis-trans isomerase